MVNKLTYLIGILFSSMLFVSCNEEVQIIGDFQETAVVYGILNPTDSVHFIKINRAFIGDGNTSSLDIAQIPDSSYFDAIDATITERSTDGSTRVWTLKDTIIENKDQSGIFYAPLQKVYVFYTSSAAPLDETATFNLDIDVNNGEFKITSSTKLVTGMTLSSTTSSPNAAFKFAENPGVYRTASINMSSVGNAYLLNAKLKILYRDITSIANNTYTNEEFNWSIGEVEVTPGSGHAFSAEGQTFYNMVKNNTSQDPAIERRLFRGIEIEIVGGAEDLYNYILINKPGSSLAQNKPEYTNLEATNDHKVIGIFSSRNTLKLYKPFYIPTQAFIRALDQKSTQELCNGPITGGLLFCSDHPSDNTQSYKCN